MLRVPSNASNVTEPPTATARKQSRGGGASIWLDVLYLSAAVLLTPYFLYRKFIKKKKSAGWKNKLGHIAERDAKPRVWIHAVSVGETLAAESLVKSFRKEMPDADVVISTTTTTGQEVAIKRYGADKVFFYPSDLSWAVKRALDRVKPSVIVLMELEVWPNFTAEACARGIPVVVVNGRITERAARRYGRFWFLVGASFKRVTRWLVQSDEYAERLKKLGVDSSQIEISGNIKYDAIDATPAEGDRASVRSAIHFPTDAPVLVGGSTHPSEEAALLDAYKKLRASSCPSLRLILVPRHPERSDAVAAEIEAAGFGVIRKSQTKDKSIELCVSALPNEKRDTWVLLIDTVGELKNMYKAADVAFIGGSLIPHGGQNVMEPCGMGVAVVHGPHMHNFNDAMEILKGCTGSIEVSRETLAPTVEKLLRDPAFSKTMATRAREEFIKRQGATKRAVELVRELMNRP